MTTNQLFFSLVGVVIAAMGFAKYYIDAKIDPIRDQVNMLVQYMISHEGKISRLEEKTRNL